MRIPEWARRYRRITEDALRQLSPERLRTTNLSLSTDPYAKGETVGPAFQVIRAKYRSLVVFVDENPKANFAHRCRYRFYDAKTQRFLYEVRARFPPWLDPRPKIFREFYEPVRSRRRPGTFRLNIAARRRHGTPVTPPPPPRERYAILFSGSNWRRHLNDMEYCYRMLTQRYLFKPENVLVLNFDKSMMVRAGLATRWPDESTSSTPLQMQQSLFGAADRDGFQKACNAIGPKVKANDLVFIFTTGHGDGDTTSSGPVEDAFLVDCNVQHYKAADFCTDLGLLGAPQSMLIVMQQCYSGVFIAPLLDAVGNTGQIHAGMLSVACASMAEAYRTDDGKFDAFSLGWITSHLAKDPYGVPPIPPVDLPPADGIIQASESYLYAEKVTSNLDSPAYADYPPAGVITTAVNAPAVLFVSPGPNAAGMDLT